MCVRDIACRSDGMEEIGSHSLSIRSLTHAPSHTPFPTLSPSPNPLSPVNPGNREGGALRGF